MSENIYLAGPREGLLENLAVLLAVANADVMRDRPRRSVTDNARRALCVELGIQRLDASVDEITAKLRAALAEEG